MSAPPTAAYTAGPAFGPKAPFAALQSVRPPRAARWFGRALLLLFLFAPLLLAVVPWQQTVQGRGQVVAYAPTERRQVVTARVGGQIVRWHVVEGSRVKAGDGIVDIEDNDPGLEGRLNAQRGFLQDRLAAAKDEVTKQAGVVMAQRRALTFAVKAAVEKADAAAKFVSVAKASEANARFGEEFERENFKLLDNLNKKGQVGLAAGVDVMRARLAADRAATDVLRAAAAIEQAQATLDQEKALAEGANATGMSAVAVAERDLHAAEGRQAAVERELQELDNRIERFRARFVRAPADGVVHRIGANAGAGGQLVKEGDELCEIVPDTADRVVELLIDGLDAPLVAAHMERTGRGPHVRLQFEGWPAVQFAGWPSVAAGTFGGRVRQMDPTDDGNGRFRILVEPEGMFDGDEWPEGLYLRQGNQAIGWVFLNRVTAGYELWRQLNGFPPVIAPKAPEKGKDESKKGGKPPKVKPGG